MIDQKTIEELRTLSGSFRFDPGGIPPEFAFSVAALRGGVISLLSERAELITLLRQADQVLAWNGYPETHPVRVGAREFGATAPGATPDPVARNR